jgi:hypothetical protein
VVYGYYGLAINLCGLFVDNLLVQADARKPYLKPTVLGIQEMSRTLTPPNVLTKIISQFKKPLGPDSTQIETAPSCGGFFR